ncbi:glycosyltransferase family 2 protein [Cohnella fermenti]|uniref:Glycosyltransferase family 2 protein n=1 Tax=Cohnella fermenti TaxID=2565925 RepID=A0A4S4BZU3_9BACL|nr:glycosyltransferase family 2 protein [Cohnella fermenti]
MRASIIIPTLNAEEHLPELLYRLHNQKTKPCEILVVDSESSDDTTKLAIRYGARVISIKRTEFDHGGTRNFAVKQAVGDMVVFITQDALPRNDQFLEELLLPLNDINVAAVSGRQIARKDASALERFTREFNYPEVYSRKSIEDLKELGIKTFFFTNVCSAIRKETFLQMGGFQEPIIMNEDMILAAKCVLQGYSVVYNPNACVIHSHDYSLLKQFHRNFDIGVSLRMNDWLLQYATAEKEGARLVTRQLGLLWKKGYKKSIPRCFAEATVKYSGYRLGLAYRKLPIWLIRRFSMHKNFWSTQHQQSVTVTVGESTNSRIAR